MDPFWKHAFIAAFLIWVFWEFLRPRKQKRSTVLFECSQDFFNIKARIEVCTLDQLSTLEKDIDDFQDQYQRTANALYKDYTNELYQSLISRRIQLEMRKGK